MLISKYKKTSIFQIGNACLVIMVITIALAMIPYLLIRKKQV